MDKSLVTVVSMLSALQPMVDVDLTTGEPIYASTARRDNGPVGNPAARKRRKAERQNRRRAKR